jgi:hypothetical protein
MFRFGAALPPRLLENPYQPAGKPNPMPGVTMIYMDSMSNYIQHGGELCPLCWSNSKVADAPRLDEYGFVEVIARCSYCGAEWIDSFALSGVTITHDPKLKHREE